MVDKIVISEIEFLQGLIVYFHKNINAQGGWTAAENKDILNDLRALLAIISNKGFEPKSLVTITKRSDKLILELS